MEDIHPADRSMIIERNKDIPSKYMVLCIYFRGTDDNFFSCPTLEIRLRGQAIPLQPRLKARNLFVGS